MPTKKKRAPAKKRPYVKRIYSPDTPFSKLTELQQRVVVYMHENECSPHDAVSAGVVSAGTVALWRVGNLATWLQAYRTELPPSPLDLSNHIQASLDELLSYAIRVIRNTLVTGKGDATGVKTAQWVLDRIQQRAIEVGDTVSEDHKAAEAELSRVLQLVQRK